MDDGGDGWDGVVYNITTEGVFRFTGTLDDGYDGVHYFCMEDGVHTITLAGSSDTISECCFEFDDVEGENFRGCAPIVDIFHTDVGHLYGAPSPAPTTSHPPTAVPTPYPSTLPTPFPTPVPTSVPSTYLKPSSVPTTPMPSALPTIPNPSSEPTPPLSSEPTTVEPSSTPTPRPTWSSETELVTISSSLTLSGITSDDFDSDAQAAFTTAVAASIDDIDSDDVQNLDVASTSRRLSMRWLLASEVVVAFDIIADTTSAGASSASSLFDSVVSDLTAAVDGGDITSSIASDSAFDGLDVSVVKSAYTEPTSYTSEYVASPTAAPHTSSGDDDDAVEEQMLLAASVAVPMVVAVLAAGIYFWYTYFYITEKYDKGRGLKTPNGSPAFALDGGGMKTPVKHRKGGGAFEEASDLDHIHIEMNPAGFRSPRGTPMVLNDAGEQIVIHRSPAAPVAPQQMKTWRKLFDAMDLNRDGVVTATELVQSVRDSARDPVVFTQLQVRVKYNMSSGCAG